MRWPTSTVAFSIAAACLTVVQLRVRPPMLLAERFLTGAGWIEVFFLAALGALLAWLMHEPHTQPRWRRSAWLLFSVVFFTQLFAGLFLDERFSMTGDPHLPVPAAIVAGPLYRREGLFMLALFASTLVLVGPAWCSHLCYLGAWDDLAARKVHHPRPLPPWARPLRVVIFVAVALGALALGLAGVPAILAAAIGLGFGLAGVASMVVLSRRYGAMFHCAVWCPAGLVASLMGKLSIFRVAFSNECDRCGACALACRFDALRPRDIANGQVASTCTLCGDCIGRCPSSRLEYRFFKWPSRFARPAFIALACALWAIFLGVARI